MNQKSGGEALRLACRRGTIKRLLDRYIRSCCEPTGSKGSDTESKTRREKGRFPNLAGFCRYQSIGLEELFTLEKEFPEEIAILYATMEDEALNSSLSPALLSAYMKKRLGYDKIEEKPDAGERQPSIRFEHDIYADGQ